MNRHPRFLFFLLLSLFLWGTGVAQSGGTPAGTRITNQASATYTDSANAPQTATSNTVTTTVLPIYSFLITPNGETPASPSTANTKTVVGGEVVDFVYTVTNQGNATDTILLAVAQAAAGVGGDTFDLTNAVIYRDTNSNGVVDPDEPTVTSVPNLPSGGTASVIIRGTVPPGIASGDIANVNLTGTSNGDTTKTDANNWARANALAQPVLNISLTANPASGSEVAPNDTITYTLSGSNTGGSSPYAVDNVVTLNGVPTDGILLSQPVPLGLTYTPGSLSGSFTYPGGITATPIYSTDGGATWTEEEPDSGVTNVGLLLPFTAGTRLNGNDSTLSYTLSFSTTVPVDALAGDDYDAIGNLKYDQNGNGAATLPAENINSNLVTHEVAAIDTLALGPDGFPAGNGTGTYNQANPDVLADTAVITRDADTQTTPQVNNGRTVAFQQSLQNTGTTTDTYELTAGLPAGFTGTVSFTDLAGNPIPGNAITLVAGATQDFLVIVTIPDDYISATPVDFTIRATSEDDATVFNETTDTIEAIVEDDIVGVIIGNSDGDEVTPPSDTPVSFPATPGQTVNIPLELTNNGNNNPDTFTLSGTSTLPGGASPVFYADDADCDGIPDGGPITSVTLLPGENICLVAQVIVPDGTAFGNYDVTTTATSPTTGATSSIINTVAVGVTEDFTFVASLTQSTNPGQPTVYQHTVTNNSNAPAVVAFTVTEPGTPGWTYEYSLDGTTYTPNIATLTPNVPAAGGTQSFFVRVTPPAGAEDEDQDSFTITATPTYNGTPGTPDPADAVTDTTTVTLGTLTLNKTVSTTAAAPGQLVTYTITGTNDGTGTVGNVQITDTLPDNATTAIADTEFVSVSATASFSGTVLYSTDGGATWSGTAPTTLGATAEFSVGIDTNASGTITDTDIVPAGGVITVTFVVQVADGIPGTTP